MDVDLRYAVADDRQVEGLGHAGDLEPRRDAARAHLIDHRDIDRALLDHVAERHDAPEVLAAGNRRGERVGDPRKAGVIVVYGDILEPEQPNPGILDPLADVDRLLRPP